MNAQPRRVLVTGGSIGIGAACVSAFALLGDSVVIADVLDDEGTALAAKLSDAGGTVEYLHADMTSADQILDGVRATEREGFDVVVANAGIARRTKFADLGDDEWDQVMNVNVTAAMRIFRAALPGMIARGGGSMITMSSVHGVAFGWGEHVHYSTSKAALIGLSRALATELGPHRIRVNGIAPGMIRTAQSLDPVNSAGEADLLAAAVNVPLGRIGEPDDVAGVATFLASAGARYITGQVLVVDGGLVVQPV